MKKERTIILMAVLLCGFVGWLGAKKTGLQKEPRSHRCNKNQSLFNKQEALAY